MEEILGPSVISMSHTDYSTHYDSTKTTYSSCLAFNLSLQFYLNDNEIDKYHRQQRKYVCIVSLLHKDIDKTPNVTTSQHWISK